MPDVRTGVATDCEMSPRRVKLTVELPGDLVEKLRDAVYWLSGPPLRLTLTEITEAALTRELRRMQTEHNGGKEFECRVEPLRAGRPVRAR